MTSLDEKTQSGVGRLMELIDLATDRGRLTDEMDKEIDDLVYYGHAKIGNVTVTETDPIVVWERRLREMEVAALAAIAFLLLRKDEEMWAEWLRY